MLSHTMDDVHYVLLVCKCTSLALLALFLSFQARRTWGNTQELHQRALLARWQPQPPCLAYLHIFIVHSWYIYAWIDIHIRIQLFRNKLEMRSCLLANAQRCRTAVIRIGE